MVTNDTYDKALAIIRHWDESWEEIPEYDLGRILKLLRALLVERRVVWSARPYAEREDAVKASDLALCEFAGEVDAG